jgi:hypothetical protein
MGSNGAERFDGFGVIGNHLWTGRGLPPAYGQRYGFVFDNGIWVPWTVTVRGAPCDDVVREYLAQRLRPNYETAELTRADDGTLTICLWFEMTDDATAYRTTGDSRIVVPPLVVI